MNSSGSGSPHENQPEYVFQTNNPGLQEVYEAVVGLGVTEPVVPMWLPDGFEIKECIVSKIEYKKGIKARFESSGNGLILEIDVYSKNNWHEYQKDDTNVIKYETFGVDHYIMQNNGRMVAVWERGSIECSISMVSDENTICDVIDSIYTVEEK